MKGTKLVALPTEGKNGLKDRVSEVFSRAKTFTIVKLEEGKPSQVDVLVNTAAELKQGAGPLAVKALKDNGVELVLSGDLGPGATTLLETIGIETIKIEPGLKVSKAIKQALNSTNELYT